MAVKSPSHRERQARATRRAVADAARALFAERGYAATTIEAIARAADIPLQTIYSAFGAKRAILEEIRTAWIAEAEVANLYATALTMPDLAARLRAAAHWTRRQFELGYDVIAAYQEAARMDPVASSVWQRALAGREASLANLIRSARGDLRPNLSTRRALDTLIVATLPEAYRTLVLERGWRPDDYERWLAGMLCRELCRP